MNFKQYYNESILSNAGAFQGGNDRLIRSELSDWAMSSDWNAVRVSPFLNGRALHFFLNDVAEDRLICLVRDGESSWETDPFDIDSIEISDVGGGLTLDRAAYDYPIVKGSFVNHRYRSLGIGKALYMKCIELFGGLVSDAYVSEGAVKLYKSLSKTGLYRFQVMRDDGAVLADEEALDEETTKKWLNGIQPEYGGSTVLIVSKKV